MKKAVILSQAGNDYNLNRVYTPKAMERLKGLVELYPHAIGPDNMNEHSAALAEAEVAFSTWGMPVFTEEQIRASMPKLCAVFYAAGSVQAFARPFLNCGVRVFSAWLANGIPVVQWTVSEILLATKGFFQSIPVAKQDYRAAAQVAGRLPGNYGSTIAILGAGVIGSGVIRSLKGMMHQPDEMEIVVFDPFLSAQRAEELGVRKVELEEAFTADVVSNHLANKEEIRGILHYGLFSRMSECGVFINTGRGAQVVEADLARALAEVPTRAAVLDVTDPEPPLPEAPLMQLPNVFLTPHMAGSSGKECARQAQFMMDAFEKMESNEAIACEVSIAMLATMA